MHQIQSSYADHLPFPVFQISTSDEEHENRTEYELARARKIQQNREFLTQQEMVRYYSNEHIPIT